MKYCERLRPLIEARERTKNDRSIPKKWKKELLAINTMLQKEAIKFFKAKDILKDSKKLLEVKNGKMTMHECQKIVRAAHQAAETESFARTLRDLIGANPRSDVVTME